MLFLALLVVGTCGADTCSLLRGYSPAAGATVYDASTSVTAGTTITGEVFIHSGATVTLLGTVDEPVVFAGRIVINNGTLFVPEGTYFKWSQDYSNQHAMWLSNGGSVGYQRSTVYHHDSVPKVLAPIIACDTSSIFFDEVALGTAVPAPFMLETSTMTVNGGTGDLVEVSLSDESSLTLSSVTALGINAYFFISSDVSAEPITPPALGVFSGTFTVGSASLVSVSSSPFIGGFWILPGAKAFFQDAPYLALFYSFDSTTATTVSGVRPTVYTGEHAMACIDSACLISLQFTDCSSVITNVYDDGNVGTGVLTLEDSDVGEFSIGSAAVAVVDNTEVDGSGGFVSLKGMATFTNALITTNVIATSSAVAWFTDSTFGPRPDSSNPVSIVAGENALVILENCVVDELFTYTAQDEAYIVSLSLPSTAACTDGEISLSGLADITTWFTGNKSLILSAAWTDAEGATIGEVNNYNEAVMSGTRWRASGEALVISCPDVADAVLTVYARVGGASEQASAECVVSNPSGTTATGGGTTAGGTTTSGASTATTTSGASTATTTGASTATTTGASTATTSGASTATTTTGASTATTSGASTTVSTGGASGTTTASSTSSMCPGAAALLTAVCTVVFAW